MHVFASISSLRPETTTWGAASEFPEYQVGSHHSWNGGTAMTDPFESALRQAGALSPTQIWLQEQLAKVPILEPWFREARLAAAATAVDATEWSSSSGTNQKTNNGRSQSHIKMKKKPDIPQEDVEVYKMFMVRNGPMLTTDSRLRACCDTCSV
jgi:hypothetical protein